MAVILLSLPVGLAVGISIWNIFQFYQGIPTEDRSFLDRPPFGFRVSWPLIQLIVYYGKPLITENYRLATNLRLKRAGVEYSLSPDQFLGGKLVTMLVSGLVAYLMLLLVGHPSFPIAMLVASGGFFYPELWLKETTERRTRDIFRALPFYLDVITLAVEAGTNLTGGISHAVQKSADGPLRSEFGRVLRDIRSGKTRADSLREMAERAGNSAINGVVGSMIQAERAGSSLGPILRAQSEQLRSMRFLKAEKLAMEAPVKLLGPLVMFIFPTTFIVIGFVILSKAIQSKVITWAPLVWFYYWPGQG